MGQRQTDPSEGTRGLRHMAGESYPLEVARRAIQGETAGREPLEDPWFIDEQAPRPRSERASQLAALTFL